MELMTPTTDERPWIAQARGPDPVAARSAQRALYQRYAGEVFAMLLRLVRDRTTAEDLLHETFVRAFQRLDQHDPTRSFRGWIHRIARNAALDELHSAAKARRAHEAPEPPTTDPGPHEDALRRERVEEARTALERLSADDRALLLARHGLGHRLGELAESLACTERTVRNRLERAAARWTRAVLAQRETTS